MIFGLLWSGFLHPSSLGAQSEDNKIKTKTADCSSPQKREVSSLYNIVCVPKVLYIVQANLQVEQILQPLSEVPYIHYYQVD